MADPRQRRRKKKADVEEPEKGAEPEEPGKDAEQKAEPGEAARAESASGDGADAPEAEPAGAEASEAGREAPEGAAAEPAEAGPAEAEPGEQERGRRRGAAETTTKSREAARPAPRDDQGAVAVRAHAKYVRSAPRKARLVMDHIRGRKVADARAILRHTPRAAATDIAKLLESAVANAENNFELDPEELRIGRAFVDEGPTIKRYRPRALGRATPIHKRTSHMTIMLTADEGAARASGRKARS